MKWGLLESEHIHPCSGRAGHPGGTGQPSLDVAGTMEKSMGIP